MLEKSLPGRSRAARTKVTYCVDLYVFILFVKGAIGTEGYMQAEGPTGHFHPALLKGPADKVCVTWPPGLEKELVKKAFCTALVLKGSYVDSAAPMRRRDESPLLRPSSSVQGGPVATTARRTAE